MTPEIFARLCAKTTDYDNCGGGGGGPSALTNSDISMLMVGLSSEAYWLALAKYTGDDSNVWRLQAAMLERIEDDVVIEGWRFNYDGQLNVMIKAAITEIVAPRVCSLCKGNDIVYVDGDQGVSIEPCKKCVGTGIGAWSETARMIACGIGNEENRGRNISNWMKNWSGRYKRLLDVAIEWDNQIWPHVSQRIGRHDD